MSNFDEFDEEVVSRTQALMTYMSALGFKPKEARDKKTMEFAKTYTDSGGRIGRVVAVIEKDAVGLEPTAPQYFTCTIQLNVDAQDSAIERDAPGYAKADIIRIMQHFAPGSGEDAGQSKSCTECGAETRNFVMTIAGPLCSECQLTR